MKKLSSWLPGPTKKLHVKVKPLKLEGVCGRDLEDGKERIVVVEMKWKGPRSRFVPFYNYLKCQRNYSSHKFLKKGEAIEWDEEFENICNFLMASRDDENCFSSWDVSFKVLYGEDAKSKTKLEVLGNVSLNIAELASKMDSQIEKKLPVSLRIDEATLWISVSFAEVRKPIDPLEIVQNSAEYDDKERLPAITSSLTPSKCKIFEEDPQSFSDSNGSLGKELGSSPPAQTERGSRLRVNLCSGDKKSWSFLLSRRKRKSLIEKINAENDSVENKADKSDNCVAKQKDDSRFTSDCWEVKELVSRDGQAKLKANVFFASFDQRSKKADGQSACAALATVIVHWLQSNQDFMPTTSQFDNLIAEGSFEWRKLCNDQSYINSFPDNHFDLETVLKADLRPLNILGDKSFTGIFSPEKFENLKGAKSFDDIWQDISSTEDNDQRVYIVSWNDHFFVLKVDADALYIIDSLGERLFEGCNQAYILKFDESSVMSRKVVKDEVDSNETTVEAEKEQVNSDEMTATEMSKDDEEESREIVCKGKDCCREFIKRFLAAIPLKELEEEEKKGKVSTFSLLKRLQIDFHYCSSTSSSLASPTSSQFSSDECSN